MEFVVTVLLAGAVIACVALTAVLGIRRKPSARPDQRRLAADPYAAQRKPDKLNPGLGGCASGGGG